MPLIDFLLTQTAVIKPWIRQADGEDLYGDEQIRKCRLQRGRFLEHTYKNPSGALDQAPAKAKMFCTGSPIPERSIVTVDDEEYTVVSCYRAYGFAEDHLEVTLE